jgi:myo-inositol 2-dehydrogenase/D-chiro-inositol 1-dehydrogenase
MGQNISVALIGAGRIGRVHAENLARRISDARLVAISDIVPDAAQKLAAELQVPAAYADHRRILEDKAIEAVIVCSSTDTHAQMIEEAAAAGKHIFCEKPIALDLGKIDRALAAVEAARVKLQIGFNRRFDPSFKHMRDLVAAGAIGTPHLLCITSRDPAPPPIGYVKVSGGIFLDMTIHDFDMARYQMGCEVEEVYATGGVLIDPAIGDAGDIDTAVTTLRFTSGAIGVIDNSRKAVYGYDQRVEIFGSAGAAIAGNKTPDTVVHSDAIGVHSALPLNFFMDRYPESFLAEMKAFVGCILEGKTPPVTGLDGRIPVVTGLAAWKSYREHRPVRLNEIAAM